MTGRPRDNGTDDDTTPGAEPAGASGLPKSWLIPAVLMLLRDLSSYGYDLMKALTAFGFALMNPGPLYRMLRQMEKDGLVRSSWDTSGQGPARRIYSITDAGEAYLKLWGRSLETYRTMMDRFFRLYADQPDNE
jgi:PadR family transcriptional regulator, regulatory protein PadR